MKVLIVEVNKIPYVKEIEGSNKDIQLIVGGYYTEIRLDAKYSLLCNEEGLPKGLPFNRRVGNYDIVGNFLMVGVRGEEYCSLAKEDAEYYKNYFS